MTLLLAPVLAFLASAAVLHLLLRYLPALAMDVANERSLHIGAIPRFGGVGVVSGIFVAAAAAGSLAPFWAGPLALIAAVSFCDDRWDLPIVLRLCTHAAVVGFGLWMVNFGAGAFFALVALLLWVWYINLFNFMDGSDGLAGSMAVVGFSGLAWAAGAAGAPDLVVPALACVGAVGGFLLFNAPPARIFMGDVGSISLGFMFGALAVAGCLKGAWPAWFPIFVTLPFWVDASLTLARRILAAEPFWRPHREHAYQRLVQMGWSHRRLLGAAVMVMLTDAFIACMATKLSVSGTFMVLAICLLGNVAVWLGVNSRWRRFSNQST